MSKMSYIYGLFFDGEQIDQTSLDEVNEPLALEIMAADHLNLAPLEVSLMEIVPDFLDKKENK